jgi:hypothetical protein
MGHADKQARASRAAEIVEEYEASRHHHVRDS